LLIDNILNRIRLLVIIVARFKVNVILNNFYFISIDRIRVELSGAR
jgi:hypothetical protein